MPSHGTENDAAKVVMHAFRRFDADWASNTGGRNLEELFRPPTDIMFIGTFAEVRAASRTLWRALLLCL